jgi:hypothetical protein
MSTLLVPEDFTQIRQDSLKDQFQRRLVNECIEAYRTSQLKRSLLGIADNVISYAAQQGVTILEPIQAFINDKLQAGAEDAKNRFILGLHELKSAAEFYDSINPDESHPYLTIVSRIKMLVDNEYENGITDLFGGNIVDFLTDKAMIIDISANSQSMDYISEEYDEESEEDELDGISIAELIVEYAFDHPDTKAEEKRLTENIRWFVHGLVLSQVQSIEERIQAEVEDF